MSVVSSVSLTAVAILCELKTCVKFILAVLQTPMLPDHLNQLHARSKHFVFNVSDSCSSACT